MYAVNLAVILALMYVPLTLYLRHMLGLPMPNPVPRELRRDQSGFTPRYWVIWLVSWVILLTPGLGMLPARYTRSAGVAYIIAAGTVGGLAACAIILFEYEGFAPT